MPRFLNTLGNSSLAVAICDRCKRKVSYSEIRSDGNIPALKVCSESCSDQFDPYRLPMRPTEKISLRFPRPDADIAVNNDAIITETQGNSPISPEQGNSPNDGNLNNLSP